MPPINPSISLPDLEQLNQELIQKLILLEKQREALKKVLLAKTGGIASFSNMTLPLVAKVFPELVVNDIVGVQPMFAPTGLVHALRYRYQP